MTRRLLLAATAATSGAALLSGSPGTAVAVLLLAGWLREHALRTGSERRLRAAVAELEGVAKSAGDVPSVRLHPDALAEISDLIWEADDDAPAGEARTLH